MGTRSEADTRGNALGQIMYSNRANEKQHLAKVGRSMILDVVTRKLVKVGNELIYEVESDSTGKYPRYRDK